MQFYVCELLCGFLKVFPVAVTQSVSFQRDSVSAHDEKNESSGLKRHILEAQSGVR
jgi:hypothetical protein